MVTRRVSSPPRLLPAVLLITVGFLQPEASSAQVVRTVTGAPCRGCTVDKRVVLTIPGAENPMVSPYHVVARDSRGRWMVSTIEGAATIAVYDSSGRRLRDFSKQGEGPGEHRSIWAVVAGPGDTLHVFDNVLRRHTIYSPSYQYVTSSLYTGSVRQAVVAAAGGLVLNADFRTPSAVGLPLHRMRPDGVISASYGAEVAGFRADAEALGARHVAAASGEAVWSIPWLKYEAELWTPGGKLAVLRRDADWFRPVSVVQLPGLQKPPTPSVKGIWLDVNGRLWTLLRVPDAKWRPQPGAPADRSGTRTRPVIHWDEEFDAIVEVIDTQTGALLASQRFDAALVQMLPGGFVTWYREDADAEPFLEIWQLRFVNPQGR